MASNNVINTELVESIARGLKFISRLVLENIFMWTSGKKNVLILLKVYFSNKIITCYFKWP